MLTFAPILLEANRIEAAGSLFTAEALASNHVVQLPEILRTFQEKTADMAQRATSSVISPF